ncbi:MAG: AsmA family protein, partial [Alphaproteobacteria bacterium]|nr:AsmA family protein [Alphaproteobacteria bacterium]
MSPSKRNKLLIGVGGVVGVVVVLLLVAPLFINLDSYKPQIASEVKKATGRDLVIDGRIGLSLLPLPSVNVTGVKFFNMPGAKNANMVEIKSVTVRPSLFALIGGNVEVSSVTLVEPKIVLEINAQGRPNWEFAPSVSEAKPAAAKPSSPKPLSLGELDVQDGTLIFSNSKTGQLVTADKANFRASVGSLDGPYGLAGSAIINGQALTVDLDVGAKGSNGLAAKVSLSAPGGKLAFKGNLSELGPAVRVTGNVSLDAQSLAQFIGA